MSDIFVDGLQRGPHPERRVRQFVLPLIGERILDFDDRHVAFLRMRLRKTTQSLVLVGQAAQFVDGGLSHAIGGTQRIMFGNSATGMSLWCAMAGCVPAPCHVSKSSRKNQSAPSLRPSSMSALTSSKVWPPSM